MIPYHYYYHYHFFLINHHWPGGWVEVAKYGTSYRDFGAAVILTIFSGGPGVFLMFFFTRSRM